MVLNTKDSSRGIHLGGGGCKCMTMWEMLTLWNPFIVLGLHCLERL